MKHKGETMKETKDHSMDSIFLLEDNVFLIIRTKVWVIIEEFKPIALSSVTTRRIEVGFI